MKTTNELLKLQSISDGDILKGLNHIHPLPLRATLYQHTQDQELLDLPIGEEPAMFGTFPTIDDETSLNALHQKALALVKKMRSGKIEIHKHVSEDLAKMCINLVACHDVPDELLGIRMEESCVAGRDVQWRSQPSVEALNDFNVVVIGAGAAGLIAGMRLREMGIPYTIIEKNEGVGGTWHANHYPGLQVDIPSQFYSFPFENGYDWTHYFAPQAEIKSYMNHVADEQQIRDNIRFNTEVTAAQWNDLEQLWHVDLRSEGQESVIKANLVISCVGALDRPQLPNLPGMNKFEGSSMHSQHWDYNVDLKGKRVAVVGAGASGIQIGPAIADEVDELLLIQRTPPWVLEVPGYTNEIPWQTRWLRQHVPGIANWSRLHVFLAVSDDSFEPLYRIDPDWNEPGSLNHLNDVMRQRGIELIGSALAGRPDLIEKSTPHYPPMVKRLVVDRFWFDTLKKENVELIASGVKEVTENSLVLTSGEEKEVDVIVWATGFKANDFLWPMEITGRNNVSLKEFWSEDGPRAYRSLAMPNFPNFFMIWGPSGTWHLGGPFMGAEIETRYILTGIRSMIEEGYSALEVKQEVFDKFQEELDDAMIHSIYSDDSVSSYFTNGENRPVYFSPWPIQQRWQWLRELQLDEYTLFKSGANLTVSSTGA